jgi:DNA-binding protein YbaB
MSSPGSRVELTELQAHADEVLAGFKRGAAEIKRNADRAAAAIEAATAEATGADGIVAVDVTVDGRVRTLRLRSDVDRLDGAELSSAIVRTVREGTVRALDRARLGVAEAIGDGNGATEVLDRKIREFSAPLPAEEAAAAGFYAPSTDTVAPSTTTPAPAAPRAADPDDEDDLGPRDGRGF